MVEEIVEKLELYSEFLELDGQDGKSHAYDKAARAIRKRGWIPPNPARLDGIGGSTRNTVVTLENGGRLGELDELRERYPWYESFHEVKHIGPARAKQIHEIFNIDTLEKLEMVVRNGDIEIVQGIGPATAEKIRESIETLR